MQHRMTRKGSPIRRALSITLLVPVLAVAVVIGTGCKQKGGAAQEQEMRNAFNDRSGFDVNKLTPSQRAGYEAAMKNQGAPPPSAPKASGAAASPAPAPAAAPSR